MRRVLKKTGSIYLHCDPTCGHYLKLLMDAIFKREYFQNQIIWKRTSAHSNAKRCGSIHDILLFYSKTSSFTWNKTYQEYDPNYIQQYYRYSDKDGKIFASSDLTAPVQNAPAGSDRRYNWKGITRVWRYSKEYMEELDSENRIFYTKNGQPRLKRYLDESKGLALQDIWGDVQALRSWHKERLGYPTQKPLALLERIIRASSNEGDLILDPFCGCGTTVHAAESLGRRWVGIDISPFSTGLIRKRLLEHFPHLAGQITTQGVPHTSWDARELARRDKFEFEKWVCGAIGAEGMFREPGEKGADGGVDGIFKIYPIYLGQEAKAEYVIVQVKGGKVAPDAVKALYASVKHYEVRAGILVCFEEHLGTVENQRSKETFRDSLGEYPVIQGYSVADLLANKPLDLPNYGRQRQEARLTM